MPHTFISYAHEDKKFALQLAQELRAAGVEVWMDELKLTSSYAWDDKVQEAIHSCGQFLVLLSPDSVSSENVKDEIALAIHKEKTIVLVLYLDCEVPLRLQRRHRVSFRDDFQSGLKKLLPGLIASPYINAEVQPQPTVQPEKRFILPFEDMVHILADHFSMGSNEREEEKPIHKVYVDEFYMDRHQVTVEQYQKFLRAAKHMKNPEHWDEQLDNLKWPVVLVTWEDAQQYAQWAGKRLPTEAEWEYAARGGMTGFGGQPTYKFPWGNEAKASHANFSEGGSRADYSWKNAKHYLKDVGSYSPNGYSLHDMSGNVWEWCSDWFGGSYGQQSPERNPQGPAHGRERVLRGGSWFDGAEEVRCAHRGKFAPHDKRSNVGFRCARDFR